MSPAENKTREGIDELGTGEEIRGLDGARPWSVTESEGGQQEDGNDGQSDRGPPGPVFPVKSGIQLLNRDNGRAPKGIQRERGVRVTWTKLKRGVNEARGSSRAEGGGEARYYELEDLQESLQGRTSLDAM